MSGGWTYAPAFPVADWVAGWTDASGPDFGAPADSPEQAATAAALAAATGLHEAAWVQQVHGGAVLRAEGTGCIGRADALWTDVPGLGVVGRSADCPLVLVGGLRPDGSPLAGFAHASWRSTVAGITPALVGALLAAGAEPGSLRAQIAPSAGPCCYEVRDDVRDAALERLGPGAAPFFTPRPDTGPDAWILDLWSANLTQLMGCGVAPGRIRTAGECTICSERYPSYRRQGQAAGRFAAMIGAR